MSASHTTTGSNSTNSDFYEKYTKIKNEITRIGLDRAEDAKSLAVKLPVKLKLFNKANDLLNLYNRWLSESDRLFYNTLRDDAQRLKNEILKETITVLDYEEKSKKLLESEYYIEYMKLILPAWDEALFVEPRATHTNNATQYMLDLKKFLKDYSQFNRIIVRLEKSNKAWRYLEPSKRNAYKLLEDYNKNFTRINALFVQSILEMCRKIKNFLDTLDLTQEVTAGVYAVANNYLKFSNAVISSMGSTTEANEIIFIKSLDIEFKALNLGPLQGCFQAKTVSADLYQNASSELIPFLQLFNSIFEAMQQKEKEKLDTINLELLNLMEEAYTKIPSLKDIIITDENEYKINLRAASLSLPQNVSSEIKFLDSVLNRLENFKSEIDRLLKLKNIAPTSDMIHYKVTAFKQLIVWRLAALQNQAKPSFTQQAMYVTSSLASVAGSTLGLTVGWTTRLIRDALSSAQEEPSIPDVFNLSPNATSKNNLQMTTRQVGDVLGLTSQSSSATLEPPKDTLENKTEVQQSTKPITKPVCMSLDPKKEKLFGEFKILLDQCVNLGAHDISLGYLHEFDLKNSESLLKDKQAVLDNLVKAQIRVQTFLQEVCRLYPTDTDLNGIKTFLEVLKEDIQQKRDAVQEMISYQSSHTTTNSFRGSK